MVNVVVILGCKRRLPLSKDKKETNDKEKEIDESYHLYSRLKKGLEVYNSIKDPEKFIICSGGVGEAESMKEFLISQNNQQNNQQNKDVALKIMLENQSLNTIENCVYTYNLLKSWYFSDPHLDARSKEGLSLHLSDFLSEDEEKDKIKDIDLQNLTIHLVTNDYHIKRSEIIFNHFKERLPITPQIVCYPANILDYSSFSRESKEVLDAIEDSKRRDLVSLMNIEDALRNYK